DQVRHRAASTRHSSSAATSDGILATRKILGDSRRRAASLVAYRPVLPIPFPIRTRSTTPRAVSRRVAAPARIVDVDQEPEEGDCKGPAPASEASGPPPPGAS